MEVEVVDIGDGGDDELTLAGVRRALERPARAVVASHVLWTTGAVLPVGALGTLAREAGAVSLIDGAQSAGAIPVALDELDVDAYAVPGQKWLLGPEGMGALWVRRAFADATIPAIAGYLAYSSFDKDKGGTLRDGARRFEATGFHRPSVIGLARSVGWLTMYVGFNWALERAARLAAAAYVRLAAIPGVRMVTPPRPRRHARHLPYRRLDRRLGRRGARAAGLCDHPGSATHRRHPHLGRVLEHGGGAGAFRGGRGAPGRSHARDDPAAPDPHRPGER